MGLCIVYFWMLDDHADPRAAGPFGNDGDAYRWIEKQEWYKGDVAGWKILPLEMPEATPSQNAQADRACGVKP